MEHNPETAIVVAIPKNITTNEPHDERKPIPLRSAKRSKNGPMHVLRVAIFMMGGRSRKSKALPVDDGSKSIWRKLVGSMRPLHLQGNQSPRASPQPNSESSSPSESDGRASDFLAEEGPYSPSPPSTRYASAVGLNELVQSDDDNEKQEEIVEECKEPGDGDEFIDARADEFIAQFYQDMRLERLNTTDRVYKERSNRSLGW